MVDEATAVGVTVIIPAPSSEGVPCESTTETSSTAMPAVQAVPSRERKPSLELVAVAATWIVAPVQPTVPPFFGGMAV